MSALVYRKPRIVAEVKFALGAIYAVRTHTDHSRWTAEQVALIQRIEADLVRLRESLR